MGVAAVEGHELGVGATFDDTAMVEDDDTVGIDDGGESVGNDDGGAMAQDLVESSL